MCGIAGYISNSRNEIDRSRLESMILAVAHRGPDDSGILVEGCVGLGHRRLSIIDLSADGHQPMTRPSTGLTIVFNGEIYNYIEIRDELRKSGEKFNTATDTEVILAAYAAWGEECVLRFNGMWAFAIFDRQRNKIFCSRDRFGVKPFYYAETPDAFVFGSEIRQLLPFLPAVRANIKVVKDFLAAGITEPPEETFFDGVRKLQGSHNLIYDLGAHSYGISRYYEITTKPGMEYAALSEAAGIFGGVFSDAVSLRLRSDVPVGTCLSGGLDSSSIATLAAGPYRNARREPFQAITAVSELPENDESGFAQKVASHSGMKWLTVKPVYDDFLQSIDEVVRAQEEPFGGPSIVMQFFVMKTARQNRIPVLLDGQGGDETLLGYERYYAEYFKYLLKRRGTLCVIKFLIDLLNNNSSMSLGKVLKIIMYFSISKPRYWNYCYRSRYLKQRHLPSDCIWPDTNSVSNIRNLQKLEIERTCLPALLRFEDKNSMWHSIETRLPFLDYRVVETALSLPNEAKINRGWTKYVLRCFMDGKMPPEITWRKNKFGFEAPDKLWLKLHMDHMHKAVSSSDMLGSLSRMDFLKKYYPMLDIPTRWRLYSVALWEKEFAVRI